jgi:hypothetical protein
MSKSMIFLNGEGIYQCVKKIRPSFIYLAGRLTLKIDPRLRKPVPPYLPKANNRASFHAGR